MSISTPPLAMVTKASKYLRHARVHYFACKRAKARILGVVGEVQIFKTNDKNKYCSVERSETSYKRNYVVEVLDLTSKL